MFKIRKAGERGFANAAGVKSRLSFSWGKYHDSKWSGWGCLVAINEVRMSPGASAPKLWVKGAEIFTVVLSGSLFVSGAAGSKLCRAGELHRISAVSGLECLMSNGSKTEELWCVQVVVSCLAAPIRHPCRKSGFRIREGKAA